MENKKFEVKIYFTGFCVYNVEVQNISDAFLKARELPINKNEVLSNLENWEEADTITELTNEESKI
ncbi:MAG: hypothetical protein WBJ84_09490 [Bacteroidales bacterium]